MAARLHLRPDLPLLRRGRGSVQLGLGGASGGIVVEGLAPQEVALLQQLHQRPADGLRPPDLYAAAARLGVTTSRAQELVLLLQRHGALVDSATERGAPVEAVGFGPGSWVVVDGRGPLADAVAALLRASGAGRVDTGRWAADVADAELREREASRPRPDRPPDTRPDLVVAIVGGSSVDPAVGEPWRARGIPLLPVLDGPGRVLVGPLVTADPALPCLRCLRLARVDRDAHWPEVMAQVTGPGARRPEVPAGPLARADVRSVSAGVVAMLAHVALAPPGDGPGDPGGGVSVEVTAPWPRLDHRRWERHPACPHDGRGTAMSGGAGSATSGGAGAVPEWRPSARPGPPSSRRRPG